ncbi:MAG TPA: LecA/PA-IL family lectin [Pyrinomonadaceae bacterium]|nr:LecA/PA-IL family lectin [Pyrinomonadaceae bacterium]
MKKFILALLIALGSFSVILADTITLRSGTVLRGNVLGFINGRFAFQLTSPATVPGRPTSGQSSATASRNVSAGEILFLRPRDIERVEIDGRSLDDARYQTRTIDVALGPNWVDTGVDLRRGQRIRVEATGTIYAGRMRITPAGLSTTDPSAPLPRAAEGELIGVIGNDFDAPIIEIGTTREITADRDGRLYMTVNRGNYTDARGAFNVRVRSEYDLAALSRADEGRNQNDNNYDPFGLPSENSGPGATRSRQRGDYNPNPNRDRRANRTLERTITVQANESRGIDTGIDLRMGDQIVLTASGNITAGQRVGVVSPDGSRAGASTIFGVSRRPVPNAGVGALIGYILQTNGQATQPVLIGSQLTLTTPADGRLYLLVNDDNFGDNSGSFSVRIVYPEYR